MRLLCNQLDCTCLQVPFVCFLRNVAATPTCPHSDGLCCREDKVHGASLEYSAAVHQQTSNYFHRSSLIIIQPRKYESEPSLSGLRQGVLSGAVVSNLSVHTMSTLASCCHGNASVDAANKHDFCLLTGWSVVLVCTKQTA